MKTLLVLSLSAVSIAADVNDPFAREQVMVCTTGAMSFLFAYGFILSGSLWTAVGLHVFGNIILHQVLGMSGGASILTPVMHRSWPDHYDPAFYAWMTVVIPLEIGAAFAVKRLVVSK